MSEAVVLADKEGRITWVNPAFEKLCGYTLKEVKGKHPGGILQGAETDPETANAFRTAVNEGLRIKEDILNYRKDGCAYWARVSIIPIYKIFDPLAGRHG